jgi:hypothetical protein
MMGGRIGIVHPQPFPPEAETGLGGYYQMTLKTGLVGTTLAAGGIIMAVQFNPAKTIGNPAYGHTTRMELKYLRCFVLTTTAFAAAQLVDCYLFKCRGFTGADTGGNQVLPATGDQKRQKRYVDSLFISGGDIRIASTAALSSGTRTVEAQAQQTLCSFWSSAIGSSSPFPSQWTYDAHNVPLIFEEGEGFEIQNGTAYGGTGKCQYFIDMGWMETGVPGGW